MSSTETPTPVDVGPGQGHGGSTYEVNIEGRIFEWHASTITPAQVRQLGGLPSDQPVIEVNFKDNTERTLQEGEVVELKPGHGFAKKVGFKRGDR